MIDLFVKYSRLLTLFGTKIVVISLFSLPILANPTETDSLAADGQVPVRFYEVNLAELRALSAQNHDLASDIVDMIIESFRGQLSPDVIAPIHLRAALAGPSQSEEKVHIEVIGPLSNSKEEDLRLLTERGLINVNNNYSIPNDKALDLRLYQAFELSKFSFITDPLKQAINDRLHKLLNGKVNQLGYSIRTNMEVPLTRSGRAQATESQIKEAVTNQIRARAEKYNITEVKINNVTLNQTNNSENFVSVSFDVVITSVDQFFQFVIEQFNSSLGKAEGFGIGIFSCQDLLKNP